MFLAHMCTPGAHGPSGALHTSALKGIGCWQNACTINCISVSRMHVQLYVYFLGVVSSSSAGAVLRCSMSSTLGAPTAGAIMVLESNA